MSSHEWIEDDRPREITLHEDNVLILLANEFIPVFSRLIAYFKLWLRLNDDYYTYKRL